MEWFDLRDPDDKRLDELAARFQLHPLHIEDCRSHHQQNAKIEFQGDYIFAIMKPVEVHDDELRTADLDVFVGPDYVITVQEHTCKRAGELLDSLKGKESRLSPGEFFHRIFDGVVDLYNPVADKLTEHIDALEEQALECPERATIERLFEIRRMLILLRRIVANSRDAVSHLLRTEHPLLSKELLPFWRDVYDHVARALDVIEVQRDLVTGATELYLSSISNQTNQVMKVLTIFGTIATPAVVITGVYGMNIHHLPFAESRHSFAIVLGMILTFSAVMLLWFRKMRWF
jgi:magnesium transporter